ncbi:MAG TPA: thiol:disulfide interchange protein DsbA/DsbL [Arenimonas sp.]|uniref:thiol:disulfide interchange protein DsbA/DsbL n=1 Tax=Arenimonas sp. TaxID=1872635 RepID=UPI002D7E1A3C|nr:thiol:disulfide interchange protein DsbA/DsbL [Arenimonas sp.]HEU0154331.1 thiol:disulfide interchange protein DsbA/DsbL [Arenimonas sp.]
MKRLLSLLLVLALAACSPAPSEPVAPAEPAAAPVTEAAAEPAAPEAVEPATEATEADTAAPAEAEPAPEATPEATEAPEASGDTAAAEAAAPAPAAELPAMPDPANAPREGRDYNVLAEPQPTFSGGPGIEVAEVFAYTCIHCANLQPTINQWKPTLAPDVNFVYVPAAFGGPGDNFARGYFAAEAMGLLDKTHNETFKAFFVDRKFQTAAPEEVADHYASLGADRDTFLSTMQSFAVTAKLNRARQFALRTGVQATPTLVIAGKYTAQVTGDRGPEGLIQTIEWLVQKERAEAARR